MTPLFKTHFSFGKSILTIDEGDGRSIIDIAKQENINPIVFVEDNLCGYRVIEKACLKNDLDFIFGWRVSCVEEGEEDLNNAHKLIIFAKDNLKGREDLIKLHNNVPVLKKQQMVTFNHLHDYWTENLFLAVPFYDSFLFRNVVYGNSCVVDFSQIKPCMFIENNNLIFDIDMRNIVKRYAKTEELEVEETKSIFYQTKEDFMAWQCLRLITGRAFYGNANINAPNLDFCSSNEFCVEAL